MLRICNHPTALPGVWHTDITDDGTTDLPDGVANGNDPWFIFAHDEGWRVLATYRSADSSPREQYV